MTSGISSAFQAEKRPLPSAMATSERSEEWRVTCGRAVSVVRDADQNWVWLGLSAASSIAMLRYFKFAAMSAPWPSGAVGWLIDMRR
jgi:hypothetical protein